LSFFPMKPMPIVLILSSNMRSVHLGWNVGVYSHLMRRGITNHRDSIGDMAVPWILNKSVSFLTTVIQLGSDGVFSCLDSDHGRV
jgi:hypothetical protein